MLDGFFQGSKFNDNLSPKQSMERRIRSSSLDLVLDRNVSFLNTSRKRNTSIIVQNRDSEIRRFKFDGRNYISFPSGLEELVKDLPEETADEYIKQLLKLATVDSLWEDENQTKDKLIDEYKAIGGSYDGEFNLLDEEEYFKGHTLETQDEKDIEESEKESHSSGGSSGSMNLGESGSHGKATAELKTMSENDDSVYEWTDTELNIDGNIPKEASKDCFYSKYTHIDSKRETELQNMSKQIVKSFKGRIGKSKKSTPTKRLSTKSIVLDNSERIYKSKNSENGKHLKVNLVIDMSGSMDGTPVRNAVEMVYIFNEIANMGYLTGSVLWSESSSSSISNFPMPRKFVKNMNRTGGGEGLGRNMQKFLPQLKEADTNICMTDGCLTDEPILKELYAKNKIEIIGVYVNKDAKDVGEYTGSLSKWFTKSMVRKDMRELTQKLISLGLKSKKK